jgi:hypothetical protein
MKRSDLVEVRAFPGVVQAADVRALRERPQSAPTRDFVGGYLGFDDRARHATETLLRSLSGGNGGAFFFNGVFGSGKSHLLGCMALLCDLAAHDEFAQSHPHLSRELNAFGPRFVVHFSLDDYAAARFSLEEIFWREVQSEWTRRGLAPDELAISLDGSRGETFTAWEEALSRRGLNGAVICIDELSLFLSGREHRALQGDAAFLQFLAQRARRSQTSFNAQSSTRFGLWIVAALQKTVEEIGDLDAYALSQIRDRFVTLPLSLAHLPSLVERRLVVARDAHQLALLCDQSYDGLVRALPHLDFGRDEWRRLYPFHPATIGLLEAVAGRFGSRTRSAVVFCQNISTQSDAKERVLPDELFDFWENELPTFPDLKPLAQVWRAWPEVEQEIALDDAEAQAMRALIKTALLFAVAGRAASVAALTNAMLLNVRLPDEGNYEYARVLLEKMRLGGAGLALERRDGVFADRYLVDSEARAGELARRFTFNALHTLPVGDRRIAQYILRCCREGEMPLATWLGATAQDVMWLNSPRVVSVEVAGNVPSVETLANRLAALPSGHNAPDFLLFVIPPLTSSGDESSTRYAANASMETLAQAWREAVEAAFEALSRDSSDDWNRWRHAVVWWLPRPATASEWEQAREATAQSQLLHDPQLADNARGRSVLEHLRGGLAEREASLARLGARLLREGTLTNSGAKHIEAGDVALGENWLSALEAITQWTLPAVFPQFAPLAPRLRVLTPSNADALCLEILRRPAQSPFFAASLERTVRGVAQPLGVAIEQSGRWRIVSPSSTRNDLANQILNVLRDHEQVSLAALETYFARSSWGLNALQTRVVLCALLRGGEVSAADARGQSLAPNEIGLPLSRSVQALRQGRLLDDESWQKLSQIVHLLTGENLDERSFASQEETRSLLQNWRDEATAQTELAQARLHQWQRRLGQSASASGASASGASASGASASGASASGASATLSAMGQMLPAFALSPGVESLSRVAALPLEKVQQTVESWREITEKLEQRHAPLMEAHAWLTHPDLVAPPELKDSRDDLLVRFDRALDDESLLEDVARWRNEYSKRYAQWHAAQHAAPRFAVYRRLIESDEMRVLNRLATVSTRSFPFAAQSQEALHLELSKSCRRDGTLASEPICASCRLSLGQRLLLRDPRELEVIAHNGLETFRQALREDDVQRFLSQNESGAPLLEWLDDVNSDVESDATTLLPLLSHDTIQLLDEAFRPRRRVARSWPQLESSTRLCRTKRQWRAALLDWLEGDDNLNDDDEIELNEPEA